VIASSCTRRLGGKGANQAVAAARAGSATRLVGQVGNDESGRWLLEFLEAEHVDIAAVTRDDVAPTGQAFIAVNRCGENSIIVVGGANARLPVPQGPAARLTSVHVLLAQLETSLEALVPVFAASLPGCIKILNAAPANRAGRRLFTHVDVLVVNETELATYLQVPDLPTQEDAVAAAAQSLIERADQSVVVTRGARGALIVRGGGVQEIAGRNVAVVDTVGAGDCFCGVLAAGLDQGLSLEAAAARANVAAGIAVGRRGAAQAMPTAAEIDAVAGAAAPF
jgi:ribokinase